LYVCEVGHDPDRDLHLVTAKVVVIRIRESIVVRDLDLMTQTLKMDMDLQGSVAGRGLMGDSASSGLAGKFVEGGGITVQCSHPALSACYSI